VDTVIIYYRYGVLTDGGHNNDKKEIPWTKDQIFHYNLQTAKTFEDILKRKTGQIIIEGIRATGWIPVVMPKFLPNSCDARTVSRDKMARGYTNVLVGFTPDPSNHRRYSN
jgi:hypothetical protein